ncbi:hypothetical protein [Fimbriiglobus ruber]|uniref:hypothetical protein n=1 Tax=Fimbriiglobus ruber TaxID=1908690 RepID=UPI001EE6B6CD|nr:hypothetical protein [Fimbriiglobus ruber]
MAVSGDLGKGYQRHESWEVATSVVAAFSRASLVLHEEEKESNWIKLSKEIATAIVNAVAFMSDPQPTDLFPSGSSEQFEAARQEVIAQSHLLRCIFNPFSLSLDPSWQTSTVLSLAQGIYTDRAFDRLPILADALEDASCDNPDILNHCRVETIHTRGCWAVDLLLGKE